MPTPTLGHTALAILAASVAILGAAFGFQYLGGLQPCPLCIWQRWPYAATILLSALAFALAGRDRRAAALLIGACGIAFLAGAAVALDHTGVERQWWQGSAECAAPSGGGALTLEQMTARIMATPVVRCDEVPWAFAGLSMASWNGLLSAALAIFAFGAAWRFGPWRRA